LQERNLTDHMQETRLDRLWQAVADGGSEADWLRFYEGFATQSLTVPVEDIEGDEVAKPKTLTLESGEVALAFDTEVRFTAFIGSPTAFVTLIGADLAQALAPTGTGVALNPGVAPGETVLDPQALAWIAEHAGAEVEAGDLPPETRIHPVENPEPALLEALGARLAEMGAHVAEAWLVGATAPQEEDGYLCILCPAPETTMIAPEIAAEITRIGQIRAARPFMATVAEPDSHLLTIARQNGIGLVGRI
jgi:hypothetical protein